ncbi:phospho-N-acetylmuramoyl-pentapeptide-transferase, partial [Bacteriovoracaceae bacterium]|nr:phospho-N-acetylmuramoyl-pentapeptide-transferase [Bacteriovoracaceae bacterium]
MKKKQFGQSIRDDGPQSHKTKEGTPTLGGIFVLGSLFITMLIAGNFSSSPFTYCLIVTFSYFILGGIDDYLKVLKKNSDGVSAKAKLIWQFTTAIIVSYFIIKNGVIDTKVYFPFLKDYTLDLGWYYILFSSFVIVGSSNAVNLTDGLDGLAIGPIIISAATLGLLAYVTGHKDISAYLYVPY